MAEKSKKKKEEVEKKVEKKEEIEEKDEVKSLKIKLGLAEKKIKELETEIEKLESKKSNNSTSFTKQRAKLKRVGVIK